MGNVLFEVKKIKVTLPTAEIISRIFDVDVLYLVSVLILVTSFFSQINGSIWLTTIISVIDGDGDYNDHMLHDTINRQNSNFFETNDGE